MKLIKEAAMFCCQLTTDQVLSAVVKGLGVCNEGEYSEEERREG